MIIFWAILFLSHELVAGGYPSSNCCSNTGGYHYQPSDCCQNKYPFLPAPPGETPACAKNGATFCERIDTYPAEVIRYLLYKWGRTYAPFIVSETDTAFVPPREPKPVGGYGGGYDYIPAPTYYPVANLNYSYGAPAPTNGYHVQPPPIPPNQPHYLQPPPPDYQPQQQTSSQPLQQYQQQPQQQQQSFQQQPQQQQQSFQQQPQQQSFQQQPQQQSFQQQPQQQSFQQQPQQQSFQQQPQQQSFQQQPQQQSFQQQPQQQQPQQSSTGPSLQNVAAATVPIAHSYWWNHVQADGRSGYSHLSQHRLRVRRQAALEADRLCPARMQYFTPQAAMNKDGNWMYVVNMDDSRYVQQVKTEICLSPNGPCSDTCTVSPNYRATCRQQMIQKRLVALAGTGDRLMNDVFWFPGCCQCQITNA